MAAVFPGAVSTQAQLRVLVNNVGTYLNGNHTSGVTTITVDDTTSFPSSGYATIDTEIFSYTGKTGTTFTGVTRGVDGTSAAAHSDRSVVNHYFVADHHNHMADEIIAVQQNISTRMSLSTTDIVNNQAVNNDDLRLSVINTGSGTAGVRILLNTTVGSGDSYVAFGTTGGFAGIGLDTSDSSKFKITMGSTILGTGHLAITQAGAVSIASTLAVGATITATITANALANPGLIVDNTAASSQGAGVIFRNNTTAKSYVGAEGLWLGTTSTKLVIATISNDPIVFYHNNSGTATATLASTGLSLPAGSAGTPSLNFSDSGTGLYRSGANQIAFSSGGNAAFRILSAGSADDALYQPLELFGAGGAGGFSKYSTTSVTTAKVIFTTSADYDYALHLVVGNDGGGNEFFELVTYGGSSTTTPTVIGTYTKGSPSARTYSQSSGNLRVAMAAGTYAINVASYGVNKR